MKNSIIVNVSELRSIVQDIRRSGCDCVRLTINDADNFEGDVIPPCISFSACKTFSPEDWVDFDDIDAVSNEAELDEKSITAVHMSSNLL